MTFILTKGKCKKVEKHNIIFCKSVIIYYFQSLKLCKNVNRHKKCFAAKNGVIVQIKSK